MQLKSLRCDCPGWPGWTDVRCSRERQRQDTRRTDPTKTEAKTGGTEPPSAAGEGHRRPSPELPGAPTLPSPHGGGPGVLTTGLAKVHRVKDTTEQNRRLLSLSKSSEGNTGLRHSASVVRTAAEGAGGPLPSFPPRTRGPGPGLSLDGDRTRGQRPKNRTRTPQFP